MLLLLFLQRDAARARLPGTASAGAGRETGSVSARGLETGTGVGAARAHRTGGDPGEHATATRKRSQTFFVAMISFMKVKARP